MSAWIFVGCGSEEKVIEGTVTTQSSGSATESSDTNALASTESTEAESQTAQTQTASYSGYVFLYKNTTIAVDADMAEVLEALGDPKSYYEAASCAFEGLDKIYTYASFEIDTYPTNDKDYISLIVLKDDSVSTAEGVYIGDSLGHLQEVYGEPSAESTGQLIYEKDGMKLCFIIQDEKVVSIEYQSTVLTD